ncbi:MULTISPECIES: restriction endonuclease [Pseudoalteromonas]|uniref:restriction endonuclease n=1 Tax=Pseudoalteromonas TaxID=53246 RepID=UPI0002CA6559|nr:MULTISPECIES: restriction endonuclease [Pseudoalteromonas]ENN99061.1 5-methylcytosine-specific restriction enzyme MRR [Pseudoalteromonas agarivorans S816]TMS65119.1 restriction endonuclease [Pseudoalteromonas sp. S1691]TMS70707.1 restriction endonuclease [Pseudoalteromonas sp. S1731]TMS72939.1 restriction endonuclease [Pseudoalteromonas sp. S1941]TMS77965.1 restriction endonuclease [Pseudoalteromonas sp. S1690]
MIPNYQEFMRPFLQIAFKAYNNGQVNEVKLRDVINQLAEQFNLSDEERTETLPSGKQSVLDNRVGWARTYLTKAGLLDVTRRAHFVITPRGIEALKGNVNINNEYLKRFDEFVAFKQKNNEPTETQSTTVVPAAEAESDITPDEALRSAYRKINDALAEEIIERTRKVTPAFFENLLIELLLAMGYGGTGEGAAHALGKSGDNGIDGVINQDPLGVDQIYIQAKRYAQCNNVASGDIRDFFGALNLKKAQKGIFITTSDFTPSAMQTAKDLGMRIVLINGKELAKLMLRYNIGSRDEQVLHLKKIDEEFFEA